MDDYKPQPFQCLQDNYVTYKHLVVTITVFIASFLTLTTFFVTANNARVEKIARIDTLQEGVIKDTVDLRTRINSLESLMYERTRTIDTLAQKLAGIELSLSRIDKNIEALTSRYDRRK